MNQVTRDFTHIIFEQHHVVKILKSGFNTELLSKLDVGCENLNFAPDSCVIGKELIKILEHDYFI